MGLLTLTLFFCYNISIKKIKNILEKNNGGDNMKDLSFNTFNELKLYAEEGGESLEQWLSEVGDPLDHESVPNDKYIKRILKDKDERMRLRNLQ